MIRSERETSHEIMSKGFEIAIDGPVAAGKGTIAPLLAERLQGFYLYTGGMYRAVALYCLREKIDINSEEKVVAILPEVDIDLSSGRVVLNGEDITERIKREDVASTTSNISTFSQVRAEMVRRQREIGRQKVDEGKMVVAEGRDTGTVVFPDASLKVFLTASKEVRARRRLEQLREQGDTQTTFEQVLKETEERDIRDSEREADPLVSEPKKFGYFVLDNSHLTEEETVEVIIREVVRKKLLND